MSDYQFQEREYEAAHDGEPVQMADLMDMLMGGGMGPGTGALGRK